MAYHSRERDPLFDSEMQHLVEKRSKELLGLCMVAVGLLMGALVISYAPEDPNWLVSTDAPVQNWLGRPGASVAAPMFMAIGWGAICFAVFFVAWGVRFVLHQGAERFLDRVIFAPVLVVVASAYAATLVPGATWSHSFGLGGLFGDMVSGSLLTMLPFSIGVSLKLLSLLLFLTLIVVAITALGGSVREMRNLSARAALGAVLCYAGIVKALDLAQRGGSAVSQRIVKGREKAQNTEQDKTATRVARFEERGASPSPEPTDKPTKAGLFARVPKLVLRPNAANEVAPEPELINAPGPQQDVVAPSQDRLRAKITDAVRLRKARVDPVEEQDTPEIDFRGTQFLGRPEPLIARPKSNAEILPPEPPIFGAIESPPAASDVNDLVLPEMDPICGPQIFEDTAPEASLDLPPVEEMPKTVKLPNFEAKKVVQHSAPPKIHPSERARAEAQPSLQFEEPQMDFELPPLGLLTNPANVVRHHLSDDALEENARMLENVLDDYGVKGEIVSVRPGPVVTMYELEPAPGLKASRVIGLADDIARSMSALSARVSTVPGRSVIGIELPNENREKVVLREILASRNYGDGVQKLPLALGKDIGGTPMVTDLAKMPHLLIAGTTGSGKSVAINTMILSLLYKLTPDECRLIMIDPKMLELSVYDGIPHLLSPVVTDPKKAVVALKWVVGEMEERYRKMSKMGVRNIDGYNGRVADALSRGEMFERTVQTGFDDDTGDPVFETEEIAPVKIPYIVVIVDEMADLMMVAGKEIEACIQRLAQMARASGIHLIMATQRPSVDVITGTIKANFPTRISFQVTSKIDSRTILGEMGAEQLLGMGDMLYMAGGAKITRCHGPFVSDEEVEEIVNHLKSFGPPDYVGGVVDGPDDEKADSIDMVLGLGGNTDGEDALYDQAVAIVIKDRKCSTSYIQRKLAIGYNKAARLVEQMEDEGLVSPANHVGKREILVPEQQ